MGVFFHTPEERWERVVSVLFWVAVMFGAFTIYGIYSRDDWRGLVMTIAPGAVCLGLWYLARARLDHMVSGAAKPLWLTITSWMFVGIGVVVLVLIVIGLGVPAAPKRDPDQELLDHIKLSPQVIEKLRESSHRIEETGSDSR